MNIQVQSTMAFGDHAALQDFMFVHRLVHNQLDATIAQAGLGEAPNYTLDDQGAMEAWYQLMTPDADDVSEGSMRMLRNWLELHGNLHRAEYAAYNLGEIPELVVIDFRSKEQFYDWMTVHSDVHDALNHAAGLT